MAKDIHGKPFQRIALEIGYISIYRACLEDALYYFMKPDTTRTERELAEARQEIEKLRRRNRELEAEFTDFIKLRAEIDRLRKRDFDLCQTIALLKARKGIMSIATYKKIRSCLHPDRVQDDDLKKGLKKRSTSSPSWRCTRSIRSRRPTKDERGKRRDVAVQIRQPCLFIGAERKSSGHP